jgi:3-keto-disaccharide hydrolase
MHEFVPIFDGLSLAGWHPAPRIYGAVYPGGPSVLEHFDQLGLARPVEPEKHPAHCRPAGLVADDPATSVEPVTEEKRSRLTHAAAVGDFLDVWRWDDWNELRIRCVGPMPVITTWVNGLKIAELDTATLESPNYDPEAIFGVLGDRGHIALEVHDNDAMFGEARWGKGAQCRWRNIRIRELNTETARNA